MTSILEKLSDCRCTVNYSSSGSVEFIEITIYNRSDCPKPHLKTLKLQVTEDAFRKVFRGWDFELWKDINPDGERTTSPLQSVEYHGTQVRIKYVSEDRAQSYDYHRIKTKKQEPLKITMRAYKELLNDSSAKLDYGGLFPLEPGRARQPKDKYYCRYDLLKNRVVVTDSYYIDLYPHFSGGYQYSNEIIVPGKVFKAAFNATDDAHEVEFKGNSLVVVDSSTRKPLVGPPKITPQIYMELFLNPFSEFYEDRFWTSSRPV